MEFRGLHEFKGLLVGGVLPALAFGLAGLLQKSATRTSPGMGPYLLCIGAGVLLMGMIHTLATPQRAIALGSMVQAVGIGLFWALGMVMVGMGISHYAVPLAKLAPLYNMNTLVVVLLALVIFAEARDVAVPRLLLGTALILAGGVVVSRA
jgi:drug/metabolite transporter (DMT)-like permease